MARKYVLDQQGNAVEEKDLMAWANWMEANTKACQVAEDVIDVDNRISTIFLGVDYARTEESNPEIFETVWFKDGEYKQLTRYGTRAQALEEHKKMKERVELVLKAVQGAGL